jgi:hypothetical protein
MQLTTRQYQLIWQALYAKRAELYKSGNIAKAKEISKLMDIINEPKFEDIKNPF